MRKIEIILPINPTPQRRARATYRAGFTSVYKDSKQRQNEQDIISLLSDFIPKTPFEGALKIKVYCFMKIPKSTSKKKLSIMKERNIYHIKKPDIDNLLKNIFDCMTKLNFFYDDTQICIIDSLKLYSESPKWDITLEETDLPFL